MRTSAPRSLQLSEPRSSRSPGFSSEEPLAAVPVAPGVASEELRFALNKLSATDTDLNAPIHGRRGVFSFVVTSVVAVFSGGVAAESAAPAASASPEQTGSADVAAGKLPSITRRRQHAKAPRI